MGWGQVEAGKQAVVGNDPHAGHRYLSVGDMALFRGEEGESWMVEINYCILGGSLLSCPHPITSFLSAQAIFLNHPFPI
jgi:hypothetical protein